MSDTGTWEAPCGCGGGTIQLTTGDGRLQVHHTGQQQPDCETYIRAMIYFAAKDRGLTVKFNSEENPV